MLADRPLHSV